MKNPKLIEPIVAGATYRIPTFKVTNDGITDGEGTDIVFCKGNKEDEEEEEKVLKAIELLGEITFEPKYTAYFLRKDDCDRMIP